VVAVTSLLLFSCRRSPSVQYDKARYAHLDSVLSKIGSPDSLADMVDKYHAEQDLQGEMVALRYQGKALRNQARFDEAMKVHARGLEQAKRLKDTVEMMMAYNNLGTDCRRKGELSLANGYHYKALSLSDAYTDDDSKEALIARVNTLNGIGNIELELCNYAVADSVLRISLEGEKKLGRNVGMAINYANLGAIKRAIGQPDSAWIYYRNSMEYNELGGSDVGVALCHLHFGELHEDNRRYSHAEGEYKKAYDMMKSLGDSWHWLESCLALANVSVMLGELDDARHYLDEAETEALRINSKEHQAKAYRIHYKLSMKEGNSAQALNYYVHADELLDSIYGLEKSDEMRNQRIEYQSVRNSDEVDVLNRDIAKLRRARNTQVMLLLLLVIMGAAIIAALIYAMRVRSRTQRLMRQVEETRSLFFTNVVHQLRTPLTSIMGAIDMIVDKNKSESYTPEQQKSMEVIERQGNNLLSLVDRILEVGGVRSAMSSLDWRTGDAVTYIRMIIESFRDRCLERHIELTYAPRETSVEVDTVPSYLSTIVGSLVENAMNYSQDFSKITVTTRVDDGEFIIRVADNGMGISKTDLPHVFEPFYRGATAESLVEGVGIGLTVVRDMAMALDGTVAVDSKKDYGSVFTVKLPCKHGDGVLQKFDDFVKPILSRSPRRLDADENVSHEEKAISEKPDVLVVEDHADVARLVGLVLSERFTVHYASNGEQGLTMAQRLVPDLIITDVKMPIMDGYGLCQRIRLSKQLRHIPIIMLSARNSSNDRIRGIMAGADAYMVKPFESGELRVWATNLVSRHAMLRSIAAQQANEQPGVVVGENVQADKEEEAMRFLSDFAQRVEIQVSGGEKLDLDKIALSFKMGESQLRRKIQELTGMNVSTYITQLRMEKAMRLLRENPGMLIGDVAEKCGFTDTAYFSRVFRQHYKMTPTQARNTNS